eukprot:1659232-Amphidinium_carterae.1
MAVSACRAHCKGWWMEARLTVHVAGEAELATDFNHEASHKHLSCVICWHLKDFKTIQASRSTCHLQFEVSRLGMLLDGTVVRADLCLSVPGDTCERMRQANGKDNWQEGPTFLHDIGAYRTYCNWVVLHGMEVHLQTCGIMAKDFINPRCIPSTPKTPQ